MLTPEQACDLIDYMEAMSERTNHQSIVAYLEKNGLTEQALNEACKALGRIAHRTFEII